MSLVDLGKALHRRVTDILCRQRIVFHHVPKCGGTSVGRALRRAYILSQGTVTPEESFRALAAVTARPDRQTVVANVYELRELMFLYLLYSDIRCVSAHVPFSDVAYDVFHSRYRFVTLLRDPVERFVSHYLWSYKKSNAHAGIDQELGDFLTTERAKTAGATYVRFFCGRPGMTFPNLSQAVEVATNNLRRFDQVGFLDDIPRFQDRLQKLTGKRLRIGRENVGKRSGMHQSIMESNLRRKIMDLCAPDQEIWNAVQDLRSGCFGEPIWRTSLKGFASHLEATAPGARGTMDDIA